MADTLVLAKFLGLTFTIMGIGIVINGKHIKAALNDLSEQHGLQFLASLIPLFLGGYIVATRQELWTGDWNSAVTVVGWLLLLSGIIRSWLPSMWASSLRKYSEKISLTFQGVVITLVGVALLYVGYLR
jgi:hypothetical protein